MPSLRFTKVNIDRVMLNIVKHHAKKNHTSDTKMLEKMIITYHENNAN